MRQVEAHAAQLLERHLNTAARATRWRFRFETATSRAGICRYTARTIGLSVSFVLRAPSDDIRTRSCTRSRARSSGPATDTTPCGGPPRGIGCTAKRCSPVTHSLKRWIGEYPRCRDRWFRQRLTAAVHQRSICPRCRSRIAWRINADGEGR